MTTFKRFMLETEIKGLSVTDVAVALDVSTQVISNWKTRKRIPNKKILQLAPLLGVSIEWLLTGKGDKHELGELEKDISFDQCFDENYAAHEDKAVLRLMKKELITLPLRDLGSITSRKGTDGQLRINRAWVRQNIGQVHGKLVVAYVTSDAMGETANDGDMIIADTYPIERGQLVDGIYIYRLDGKPALKRLQNMPGDCIKSISDNDAYESFVIEPSHALEILGRVRWVWNGKRI